MINKILTTWKSLKSLPLALPFYAWAVHRFSGYKPQPVTIKSVAKWLNQFDEKDRLAIMQLLRQITYLSEKETENLIVTLNAKLLERLSVAGISLKNVIYMQVHDPGSSSVVILNMLRDRARLERQGCYFIDSKNVRELYEVTSKLEQGAIIYVDDFAATGHQFCTVRDFLKEHIIGNFSEFFLLPCICEEAFYELGKRGVEAVAEIVHSKTNRPLHNLSSIFDSETKKRLTDICYQIDKKGGLGYRSLATMIVFYRNAPNTTPSILRGCIRQKPYAGVLPRTTDLP